MTTPDEMGLVPNEDGTYNIEDTPMGRAQRCIELLSEPDFQALRQWFLRTEVPRREAAHGQAEMIRNLRGNGHVPGPAAPEAPTGVEDFTAWADHGHDQGLIYLLGDRVAHQGRVWESRVAGTNHWEPGAPGIYAHIWADITDLLNPPPVDENGEPGIPVWAAGQTYTAGDQITYQDATYTVLQGHTSQFDWTPDAVPALYKKEA